MRIKSFLYLIGTAILTVSTGVAAHDCGPGGNRFSGRAFILSADVLGTIITASDTGELPRQGGTITASGLNVDVPLLGATANVATATTSGSGETAESSAEVASLSLTLVDLGVPLLPDIGVTADVIEAHSSATCDTSNIATASGSTVITNLEVAGIPVSLPVPIPPNFTVPVDVLGLVTVTLVLNEQSQTETVVNSRADITVNAVHATVSSILLGELADVIISSAKSDIVCR